MRVQAILSALLTLAAAFAARAEVPGIGPWQVEDQARARLVAAIGAVGVQASVTLGLEIRLAPGWKTYWRNPGDSGLAPAFDWAGSDNLRRVQIDWPAPKRWRQDGQSSFVYEDHVVLPLAVQLDRPERPLALRLALDYAVCREVCIPLNASLALDLPAGAARPAEMARTIARFAARVPRERPEVEISAEWSRGGGYLILSLAGIGESADVFVEGPDGMSFGPPEKIYDRLRLGVHGGRPLPDTEVTATLVDGPLLIERRLKPFLR
ncbi:MAG: hypothetical protein FJX46_16435 [Alphaproteobacteria bacterium]|nr:hypothetical protein [Alphaproteobacteria bacterium]